MIVDDQYYQKTPHGHKTPTEGSERQKTNLSALLERANQPKSDINFVEKRSHHGSENKIQQTDFAP